MNLCDKCLYPKWGNCPAKCWHVEFNGKDSVSQCDVFDDGKQNFEEYPLYDNLADKEDQRKK